MTIAPAGLVAPQGAVVIGQRHLAGTRAEYLGSFLADHRFKRDTVAASVD